jgi:hypothetical protein
MMRNLHTYFSLGAVSMAAACATASGSGFTPGQSSNGIGGDGGVVIDPNFGSDATLVGNGPDGALGPDADDSGLSLSADGAVVGTCVTSRTCNAPDCDELVENGQHHYIEPKPDDGSALPTQTVAQLDTLFASPSTSGGPCIVDPPQGSIFPHNWLRPRIFFQYAGTGTIFQITIHAARQANDLVVYTRSTSWEIPDDVWKKLADSTWSEDITVTVAASSGSGTAKSSQTTFQIAPANANGSMIYWAAVGDEDGFSWLEGFRVGDEGVSKVLTSPTGPYANPATDVQWTLSRDSGGNLSNTNRTTNVALKPTGGDQCIGCHVAAPDQTTLTFLDFYPWDGVAATVGGTTAGGMPTWMTPGGAETLSQGPLGMMSFSPGTWTDTQHLVVAATQVPQNPTQTTQAPWNTIMGDINASNLIWIDLSTPQPPVFANTNGTPLMSANSGTQLADGGRVTPANFYANQGITYGYINRTGDANSASTPAWSHDGTRIAYSSNNAPQSGRIAQGKSDIYMVPFDVGTKQGGAAKPVAGASSGTANEYYPAFSADDKYLAFNSAPPANTMYYNADAEVYVVPSNGGSATRLKANDPASCATRLDTKAAAKSPGVTNSWARWSPEFPTCQDGKTYYWLIFSSSRLGLSWVSTTTPQNWQKNIPMEPGTNNSPEPTSQLYLTAVVDDNSGSAPTTYPATFIWNQPITSGVYAQSNHTPAWEVVEIQPPPPTPPPPPPPPPR